MHGGAARRDGQPRIDHHEPRRVRSVESVEHAHPEHRLRLGDVVTEQGQGVGMVDIAVGPRLAVAAEGLLERFPGRRRAEGVLPSRWFVPMPARAMIASV